MTERKNLNIIKNGVCDYKIIYPKNVTQTSATLNAVNEFVKYVYKSTKYQMEIASDLNACYRDDLKYISIGKTELLKSSGIEFAFNEFKNDCFFIKTQGNSVFIDGKTDRAVLYGVYEFLERFIGVKFLAFDDTYIPIRTEFCIPFIDKVFNPDFNLRVYSSEPTMRDVEFLAHNRMVDEFVDIPERWGGNLGQYWDKNVLSSPIHNSMFYVEPSIYEKCHKDWFYYDYKNKNHVADLCYSNVGLNEDGTIDESLSISPVKVVIEKLKKIIKDSKPEDKYFFFGQMDAGYENICNCPKCLENEKKYGRSGMMIRFLNAVDNAIQKWIKDEKIGKEIYLCTFAYQWSEMPPVKKIGDKFIPLDNTVIPNDTVIIRFCTIRINQYYSVIDDKQLPEMCDMINGWRVILKNKRSMVWSYHSRFTYPFCFFSTMHHWKDDFKVYKEIGCEYVYMQPNHFEKNDWKSMMESYVASKVMWDNSLDVYALRDEYIKYYYTIIARLVKKYILNFENLFNDLSKSNDCPDMRLQSLDQILLSKYYSVDFWKVQFSLVEKMYEKVNNSSLSKQEKDLLFTKIDRIKLTNESTVIYKYDDYKFDDAWKWTKQSLINDFFFTCDKLGVKMTGEWQTIQQLKQEWGYKFNDKCRYPKKFRLSVKSN